MVLKPSHFVGELTIAQSGIHTPSEFAFTEELQWYVDKYEPIIYRILIGEKLYRLMIDGMTEVIIPDENNESEVIEPIEPNKWDILASHTVKIAAAFVWYHYMLDNNTQTTGSGEIVPLMESGTKKSAQPKMVRVWNQIVDSIYPAAKWICEQGAVENEENLLFFFGYLKPTDSLLFPSYLKTYPTEEKEGYPEFEPDIDLFLYYRLNEYENLFAL